jgi:hypothetical protein
MRFVEQYEIKQILNDILSFKDCLPMNFHLISLCAFY